MKKTELFCDVFDTRKDVKEVKVTVIAGGETVMERTAELSTPRGLDRLCSFIRRGVQSTHAWREAQAKEKAERAAKEG